MKIASFVGETKRKKFLENSWLKQTVVGFSTVTTLTSGPSNCGSILPDWIETGVLKIKRSNYESHRYHFINFRNTF